MKKIFLILFLATGLNYGFAQEQSVDRSYKGIARIDLSTGSGNCEIVKGGKDVRVQLTYTYDSEVFEPILEQNGDRLSLKEEFKRNNSGSGSSKWKLTIPENIRVTFNTGSGDFSVADIAIKITTNSGSGNIVAKNTSGSITSNSGSGNTEVDQFDGEITMNAGSGGFEISNSKGEFTVNLGSGDIDTNDVTGEFTMNVGSGDIDMNNVLITEKSSFNTGSGDATVSIAGPLTEDISINSGSGDATLDFNGETVEGMFTMKANKKNGDISAPFEFDKVVEEGTGNEIVVKKTAKVGNSSVNINISTGSGQASVKK
jgi:hypothetical protein